MDNINGKEGDERNGRITREAGESEKEKKREREGSYVFHVFHIALRFQQSTDSSLLLVDDEVTSQQVSVLEVFYERHNVVYGVASHL